MTKYFAPPDHLADGDGLIVADQFYPYVDGVCEVPDEVVPEIMWAMPAWDATDAAGAPLPPPEPAPAPAPVPDSGDGTGDPAPTPATP